MGRAAALRGAIGLCALMAALILPVARPARAQGRPPIEAAQRAMEKGVAAVERGDHEAALLEFRRAQELVPGANVPHRFEARSLEALGRWAEAIAAYTRYLEIKPDVSDAAEVRAKIDELRAAHLEGLLDVVCQPDGARVFIDGNPSPAGVTPLRALRLPIGEHEVRVEAAGRHPLRAPAVIRGGASSVVAGELAPDAVRLRTGEMVSTTPDPARGPLDLTVASPARDEPEPTRPWYRRWYVWAGAAAVTVGVSVGAWVILSDRLPDTQGGTKSFP
ncbi:MAG TPA: PEGA domain-containing protein [Kofleriaceae bacterium]|nr:PEGA domain-containing protein [Kofleriaceae bacterium]